MRKYYLSLFVLLVASGFTFAQQGGGAVKGKVTDAANGEGVPFCNVIVYLNGNQVKGGANTDFDGNFQINSIPAGSYDLEVRNEVEGYKPQALTGVIVSSDKIQTE